MRLLAAWADREISSLDPGCFALVMATGIISNGFYLHGHRQTSDILFALGLIAYPWLWLLTALRAARFGAALRADLTNPGRVFSFFTIVAATDVLGTGIGLRGFEAVAFPMWLAALAIWLILIYLGFGVLIFLNASGGADVTDGAWLNGIVGTQSLVILGAQSGLIADNGSSSPLLLLICMLWALGIALYGIVAVLLCYRLFYFEPEAQSINPILWVLMGAAAISANAGSALVIAGGSGIPLLRSIQPFIYGIILCMWAWATWWIPLLILLGIWKHGVRRVPIRYTPLLWSIVFPLGMYAVATLRLSRIADAPTLQSWSEIMTWIAFGAWIATGAGLATASWHRGPSLIERNG